MEKENTKYKLPAGWVEEKLGKVTLVSMGQSPASSSYNTHGVGLPFYQGKTDFGEFYPTVTKYCSEPIKIADKDDILISVRAPIGPTNLTKEKSSIGRGLASIKTFNGVPSKFILYQLRALENNLVKLGTGTTFQAVSKSILEHFIIKVAPLKEQERIVSRIEELFSELNHSEVVLKKAQMQLKVYKQVLLKSAFDGNLTKSWREIYKDENYKWLKSKIEDIGVVKGGKRLPKGGRYSNIKTKFPYLRVSDFTKYSVNQYDLKYIDIETRKKIENYTISKDDVYISIAGTIGLTGIVPENLDNSNLTENAAKIVVNSNVNNKFLAYALNAPDLQSQIIEKTKATSQPKLSLYSIRSLQTFIPALDEQYRIVQILDSRFTLIENLDISINAGIKKIEVFRQTILKKAFEGKLATQYSSDESANILLIKINKEKDTYLNLQKEANKVKPKKNRTMDGIMTILEILKQNDKPILAKELWQASKHKNDIESFYAELKEIYSQIIEVKIGTESLLSLKK